MSHILYKRRQVVHACDELGTNGELNVSLLFIKTSSGWCVTFIYYLFTAFFMIDGLESMEEAGKPDLQATDIVLHLTTRIPVIV